VSNDNAQLNSPFSSRGFIAAAIVVGVIVLAAVIALVTTLTSPHDPVAQPTSTPSSPVATGDDKSVCGLPGFETQSSLTDAPKTKWELVGTVAAPTDPKVGPGKISADGFRSCFAHTAEGALYFAVNYLALGTDGTLRDRLPELVQAGPGRDALTKAVSNSDGTDSAGQRAQVAGFKIGAYDGKDVTVDLALNYSDGRLISAPLKLIWAAGDWKMVLSNTGQLPLAPGTLESLGGYIPWAGA
jgi:hypothetical protein